LGAEQLGDPLYQGIRCRLRMPRHWLGCPVDGVMVLQVTAAGLAALDAIGERFGWGPVPVPATPLAGSELDSMICFAPSESTRPYEGVAARAWQIVAGLSDDEVLVVAPAEAFGPVARARERMLGCLGRVTAQETLTTDHGKALHTWTFQTTW
jgi:hypothetical protein